MLSEAPPASRFILRGAEAVRVACGMAFGVEPPSRLGPAGESEGRASFWLGPDEWLLIADGADAADIGGVLESVLEGTAHSLVDVSHCQIGLIASGLGAARPQRRLPARSRPQGVSGRHGHAYAI
jgi:sarcosine oxidase subunit gamma